MSVCKLLRVGSGLSTHSASQTQDSDIGCEAVGRHPGQDPLEGASAIQPEGTVDILKAAAEEQAGETSSPEADEGSRPALDLCRGMVRGHRYGNGGRINTLHPYGQEAALQGGHGDPLPLVAKGRG